MRLTSLLTLSITTFVLGLAVIATPASRAQTLSAPFASNYTITDLGTPTGVPGPFGGLTLLAGSTNTLLLGGNANNGSGGIYQIGVLRDANNHITGFTGSASLFATAPNIDGGLAYGPGGVLFYTAYPSNQVGQIKSGSSAPDKIVSLPGVTSSVGSLLFAPNGNLKLLSYNGGGFYDVSYTDDGTGTFNLGTATLEATLSGGPEGAIYVPTGSANFTNPSMLVSQYAANKVSAFEVDANGAPIVGTARDFITGLNGAEGAFLDPLTGDFLFSTFGSSNRVIAVRGFAVPPSAAAPEPGSLALALPAAGLLGIAIRRRRRNINQIQFTRRIHR